MIKTVLSSILENWLCEIFARAEVQSGELLEMGRVHSWNAKWNFVRLRYDEMMNDG